MSSSDTSASSSRRHHRHHHESASHDDEEQPTEAAEQELEEENQFGEREEEEERPSSEEEGETKEEEGEEDEEEEEDEDEDEGAPLLMGVPLTELEEVPLVAREALSWLLKHCGAQARVLLLKFPAPAPEDLFDNLDLRSQELGDLIQKFEDTEHLSRKEDPRLVAALFLLYLKMLPHPLVPFSSYRMAKKLAGSFQHTYVALKSFFPY